MFNDVIFTLYCAGYGTPLLDDVQGIFAIFEWRLGLVFGFVLFILIDYLSRVILHFLSATFIG